MNIYLKKDSIDKLFDKVKQNLIFSDDEAPANKFLMGDYTKVFTDDTESFINAQKQIFNERASIKFPRNTEKQTEYIDECVRITSPTEGVSCVGIQEAGEKKVEENNYTFFLDSEDNTNTPTWIHDNDKDIYQELTKWLKDNVFKEESYSSYKDKFNDFITNAFNGIDNRKITDIIIYDPYILETFHKKKNDSNENSINSTLFNQLKNLEKLNIIIFTSNIIKCDLARKKIYDELNKHNVTFITIPQSAHDRFILSNYFYIKSGKGFMLDLDENLGNDVTASKIGINTRKTFLEWSEKINILQNYLDNNEAIIGQGECKSGILSLNSQNLDRIIQEKWDDLLYTAILQKSSNSTTNYKAIIRMTPDKEEIDGISDLNDETLEEIENKIKRDYETKEEKRLINCLNNAISEFSKDAKIPINWFLGEKIKKNQLIQLCKLYKSGLNLNSQMLVDNIKYFYDSLPKKLSNEKLSKFKPAGDTSDSDDILAHEFMEKISDSDLKNKTDYIINIFNHLCKPQQNNNKKKNKKNKKESPSATEKELRKLQEKFMSNSSAKRDRK